MPKACFNSLLQTHIDGVEEGEFITMLVMPVMLNSQT